MSGTFALPPWLLDYKKSWLGADLASGANVWAVLIPTALAYSSLVGVNPIIGLFCVPAALLAYAFLGGSKLLVVGPDASVAVLAGATLATVGLGAQNLSLVISLSLLVGLLYILCFALRLGWISDLIPDPVMKGMVEGIVWVTILKQVVDILGVKLEGEHQRFLPKLFEVLQTVPETHISSAVLGIGGLIALLAMRKFAPRLPSAMIMLAVTTAIVWFMGLDKRGVSVLGGSESQSPSFADLAVPTVAEITELIPGALALVLIGFTASIAAAKRAAEKTGERIDPNQELLAVGAANVGAGLSGGYPVAGTLSKTAVAMESGGKTQLGNLFTALLGVVTIFFLIPLFSPTAKAALAALVIFVMIEVSDLQYFARLWKVRKMEFVIALLAFAGVLAYGPLGGVLIGVLLSLVVLADHISRPPSAVLQRTADNRFIAAGTVENASEIEGLLLWRFYGPLVFLNARRLSETVRQLLDQHEDTKVVLVDASAISGIDSTGTTAFRKLAEDLADQGVEMWVANLRQTPWERVAATLALSDTPQIVKRFGTLEDAVSSYDKRQSPDD
ncbi:MAG: SulP family inorganic anion transporter [Hyphomicrobiaceae bacterium]